MTIVLFWKKPKLPSGFLDVKEHQKERGERQDQKVSGKALNDPKKKPGEIPLYLEGKDFFLIEWGREYFQDIVNEVGEGFNFYILEITMNELKSAEEFPSRNFFFKQIKI